MRRSARAARLSQGEREGNVARVARGAAESALCHLAYVNRLTFSDARFEEECAVLEEAISAGLAGVDLRALIRREAAT